MFDIFYECLECAILRCNQFNGYMIIYFINYLTLSCAYVSCVGRSSFIMIIFTGVSRWKNICAVISGKRC